MRLVNQIFNLVNYLKTLLFINLIHLLNSFLLTVPAIQGLNLRPIIPQRPPQLILRPLPVPPIIRPALPPIVERLPVAVQLPIVEEPLEGERPLMVEEVPVAVQQVPAVGAAHVQNIRNQLRGVRRRGEFENIL